MPKIKSNNVESLVVSIPRDQLPKQPRSRFLGKRVRFSETVGVRQPGKPSSTTELKDTDLTVSIGREFVTLQKEVVSLNARIEALLKVVREADAAIAAAIANGQQSSVDGYSTK